MKKITTEEFVKRAKEIHGDKYDYSLTEYDGNKVKVKIICPLHGVFEKQPNKHLSQKQGCPHCSDRKITTETFINRANEIHGSKYDYSKSKYVDNHTKIKIICPEHGVFEKTYTNHITNKQGCPYCSNMSLAKANTLSKETVISRFKEIHGDKYDYSMVNYRGMNTKVKILSKEHGVFEQTPQNHLRGYGHKKDSNKIFDYDSFVQKAKSYHSDKYDYSEFEYTGMFNKSILICKKHNHNFEVTPNNHIHSKFGGKMPIRFEESII
jgi:hypothetical protein